jgi:hypothetical protein
MTIILTWKGALVLACFLRVGRVQEEEWLELLKKIFIFCIF